jgi:uncharacterized protein (DUF983 family)
MMAIPAARGRLAAILTMRCPRCREGRVFASRWRMNDRCPSCGLLFMRGTGYFTGAMYFSYAMGIPLIAMLTLAVYLVAPSWALWQDVLLAWVLFLPLVGPVFRYSRVLWIHFDQYFDPAPPGPGRSHDD